MNSSGVASSDILRSNYTCCKLCVKARFQIYYQIIGLASDVCQCNASLSWDLPQRVKPAMYIYLIIIIWLIFHSSAL